MSSQGLDLQSRTKIHCAGALSAPGDTYTPRLTGTLHCARRLSRFLRLSVATGPQKTPYTHKESETGQGKWCRVKLKLLNSHFKGRRSRTSREGPPRGRQAFVLAQMFYRDPQYPLSVTSATRFFGVVQFPTLL